ncbi:DUF5615 family PIN-like protein [soil metagenome]
MPFKLLIDECLSPELADMSIAAGHVETTCVRNRGWLGAKDHELMRFVVDGDFTLVTHNARDFRGPAEGPPSGLHARERVHAGLICPNSHEPMDIDRQRMLFEFALAELATMEELINRAMEVSEAEDGSVSIMLYQIPQDD